MWGKKAAVVNPDKFLVQCCVAFRNVKNYNPNGWLRTILRAEKLRIGSSAARETELSMMKTRMRLVKIWWLISLWQNTRNLQNKGREGTVSVTESLVLWHNFELFLLFLIRTHGLVLLKMKKALPAGMGGVFSLMVSSDILRGRGPEGTSGRSSLLSSSSSEQKLF